MTLNPELEGLCQRLPWDSAFFGFPVARILASQLNSTSTPAILSWCSASQIRCLYFAAEEHSHTTLDMVFQNGFQYVDTRLELSLSLKEPAAVEPIAIHIRPAIESDLTALQAMATQSHRDSRFFKDSHFQKDRAGLLYAVWIERDFKSHTVFVASFPSDPDGLIGYVSCHYSSGEKAGTISLLALLPGFHGIGAGRALLNAGLHFLAQSGAQTVFVATQASNVAAQRLYQAAGFRTMASRIWFHRWF